MLTSSRKAAVFCVLLAFSLVILAGCGGSTATKETPKDGAAAAIKMPVSHTSSLESPWQKGAVQMAAMINKESNGKFNVEVFGNGVLNQKNWKIMFEQTQAGSNTIAIESVTALGSLVNELSALNLPFMFDDVDHMSRFIDSNPPVMQKWLKKFEEKNLVVLAVAPRPFRQLINSKHLIKTPDDIAGMKFRVPQNPLFVKVFEAMGAKPVPLPSGEIYSAIQLGTVFGEDNSVPVVYDFKTHEVAKFMTIWNYMGDASLVVMNKPAWDKLTDAEKALFKKAGKLWTEVNVKEDTEYAKKSREAMEKLGVKFYDMTAADKKPFADRMAPVYTDFEKVVGAEDFKAFREAIAKTRK